MTPVVKKPDHYSKINKVATAVAIFFLAQTYFKIDHMADKIDMMADSAAVMRSNVRDAMIRVSDVERTVIYNTKRVDGVLTELHPGYTPPAGSVQDILRRTDIPTSQMADSLMSTRLQ